MKIDVLVLVVTDPTTRIVQPVACNTDRGMIEQAKQDAADNLEMTMAYMKPSDRDDMRSVIKSLRIIEGKLEIDA